MGDVMLAWWTRARTADADELGATVVEYLMVVALLVAAAVLVTTLGVLLAGNAI
jgi:Flp pilus assembly pilin Flp